MVSSTRYASASQRARSTTVDRARGTDGLIDKTDHRCQRRTDIGRPDSRRRRRDRLAGDRPERWHDVRRSQPQCGRYGEPHRHDDAPSRPLTSPAFGGAVAARHPRHTVCNARTASTLTVCSPGEQSRHLLTGLARRLAIGPCGPLNLRHACLCHRGRRRGPHDRLLPAGRGPLRHGVERDAAAATGASRDNGAQLSYSYVAPLADGSMPAKLPSAAVSGAIRR